MVTGHYDKSIIPSVIQQLGANAILIQAKIALTVRKLASCSEYPFGHEASMSIISLHNHLLAMIVGEL
jgi:hypothetical protein